MSAVESVEEPKLYSIRWSILFFVGIAAVLLRIVEGMIGVVNNVYVAFFQVSYLTVDWFTLMQLPGVLFASLTTAVLVSTNKVSIRKLAITMAACFVFTTSCFLMSYIVPQTYPSIFVAKFVFGFGFVLLEAVSSSFSISWFPEEQVGTALSTRGIGDHVGSLLGYLIPSNTLISPPHQSAKETTNGSHANLTMSGKELQTQDWFHQDKIRFIAFSSALLFVSAVTLIFFVIFYADRPPSPPTRAQAILLAEHNSRNEKSLFKVLIYFWKKCLELLQNLLFLQYLCIKTVGVACFIVQKFLVGQILRDLFIDLGYVSTANTMAGYVLVTLDIGAILGEIATGFLVNYNKNYKTQVSILLLAWAASTAGLTLSYYYRKIVGVFAFSFLFGVFECFYIIPLRELVYQHFYPTKPSFVDLLIRFLATPLTIVISQTFRLTLDKLGGLGVLIYHCIIVLAISILSLWMKPSYKRLEAGLEQNLPSNGMESEETRLLNGH